MTPEQRKMVDEARRRREQVARELQEAVAKALAAREERLKALLAAQQAELAKEAASRLKGSGKLETATDAEAKAADGAASRALAEAREIMSKLEAYFQELRGECPEAADGLADLVGEVKEGMDRHRLDLIFDSVRAALAKEITGALRTEMYRSELGSISEARPQGAAGADLAGKAVRLMGERRIRSDDMDKIRLEYLKLLEEDRVASVNLALLKRAREVLSERGYRMLDAKGRPVLDGFPLARNGTYWFAGANPDFRVRAEVDVKGGLNLQQMRVAATSEEARQPYTQYTRELELRESQKWCGAQDALAEVLERENARYVHTIHRKPGVGQLPVLVDKDMASFGVAGVRKEKDTPLVRTMGGEDGSK
jgi:hypothetical protein